MATLPIASRTRLDELGLSPGEYGSCSQPDQRSIPNKGRVWLNRGCGRWHDCPWKDGTLYQVPRDENDTHPRPRNVRTRFIKPNPTGPGDRVLNSYCTCFQFLGGLKRRDGQNQEIAEVTGGEGDVVGIKTSERKTKPDGSVYFDPAVKDVTIPIFPDPTEDPELFEDVYAAKSRLEYKSKHEDAERARRLGGPAAPPKPVAPPRPAAFDIVEAKPDG